MTASRFLTDVLASSSYLFFRVFCRGTIQGRERLDGLLENGCILAPNHSSYLDWMVLGALFRYRYKRRLTFFAKDRLFRHSIFGPVMQEEHCVRVSDDGEHILGGPDLTTIKYLCIFPEGKRSRDGRLGPAHTGVVKYAAKLSLPILPVGLKGFHEAWPPGQWLPRPASCRIAFGVRRRINVPPDMTLTAENLQAETSAIMAEIGRLIGQPAAHD